MWHYSSLLLLPLQTLVGVSGGECTTDVPVTTHSEFNTTSECTSCDKTTKKKRIRSEASEQQRAHEKKLRKRAKKREQKRKAVFERETRVLPSAPLEPCVIYVRRKYKDDHVQAVFSGCCAYPRGCGSFVDGFPKENFLDRKPSEGGFGKHDNLEHYVEDGNLYEIRDEATEQVLYWMYPNNLQEEGNCHMLINNTFDNCVVL